MDAPITAGDSAAEPSGEDAPGTAAWGPHMERRKRIGVDLSAKNPAPALETGSYGEGGIRTPGQVTLTPVFETGPFSRSGTSPAQSRAH